MELGGGGTDGSSGLGSMFAGLEVSSLPPIVGGLGRRSNAIHESSEAY